MKFGNVRDKNQYVQNAVHETQSVGEYIRVMLHFVANKEVIEVNDVCKIIRNHKDGESKIKLIKQMYKRPKTVSYLNWLYLMLEKYERSKTANCMQKATNSAQGCKTTIVSPNGKNVIS